MAGGGRRAAIAAVEGDLSMLTLENCVMSVAAVRVGGGVWWRWWERWGGRDAKRMVGRGRSATEKCGVVKAEGVVQTAP